MTTPAAGRQRDRLRFAAVLAAVLTVVTVLGGIAPADRTVWVLENVLPVFVTVWLAVTARSFTLSAASYGAIFCFMCLHQAGAHYTYPAVPYEDALRALGVSGMTVTGEGGRNAFDRIVHGVFGLAFALPLREVVVRLAGVASAFWADLIAFSLLLTAGLLYEGIEWAVAAQLGPGSGDALLGAQGDVWDSHHDMLMASIGAAVALAAASFTRAARRRVGPRWR